MKHIFKGLLRQKKNVFKIVIMFVLGFFQGRMGRKGFPGKMGEEGIKVRK